MNIHTLYAQAHEELRQLSVQLARTAEQMAGCQHLHPLDRPTPSTSDYTMKVVHVQHLLAQYDTLLRLGIDHAKGFSHEATFERLPAAPQRFAEGPSIEYSIRYQKEPPEPEPEIPALEVTPPSEVKPDMPGWLK